MDNVKKKEHDVIIKGIVIHKVIKDAHKTSCSLKLAEKLISPKEREIAFVANVKDAYYKKLSPTYGILEKAMQNSKNYSSSIPIMKYLFLIFLKKELNIIRLLFLAYLLQLEDISSISII